MSALFALAMQVATQPPASPADMTQARLDAITQKCGAPREWLLLRGREIVFRGSPDADPAKLECVLKKMSAALDATNRGFGNAQLPKDK